METEGLAHHQIKFVEAGRRGSHKASIWLVIVGLGCEWLTHSPELLMPPFLRKMVYTDPIGLYSNSDLVSDSVAM